MVKRLLEKGAEVTEQSSNGLTPLHVAADYGHLEVVKFLLENGANVIAVEKDNETALWYAAQKRHDAVLIYLYEYEIKQLLDAEKPMHAKIFAKKHFAIRGSLLQPVLCQILKSAIAAAITVEKKDTVLKLLLWSIELDPASFDADLWETCFHRFANGFFPPESNNNNEDGAVVEGRLKQALQAFISHADYKSYQNINPTAATLCCARLCERWGLHEEAYVQYTTLKGNIDADLGIAEMILQGNIDVNEKATIFPEGEASKEITPELTVAQKKSVYFARAIQAYQFIEPHLKETQKIQHLLRWCHTYLAGKEMLHDVKDDTANTHHNAVRWDPDALEKFIRYYKGQDIGKDQIEEQVFSVIAAAKVSQQEKSYRASPQQPEGNNNNNPSNGFTFFASNKNNNNNTKESKMEMEVEGKQRGEEDYKKIAFLEKENADLKKELAELKEKMKAKALSEAPQERNCTP